MSGSEELPEEENEVVEREPDEEVAPQPVTPKKRVTRAPQPKFNDQRLKGPRGLTAVEKHFQRVKFLGKGHEERDLNVLLKTYEYWCHRLFPKFAFGDSVDRLEKLGKKRSVMVNLKKIRSGLEDEEEDNIVPETEDLDEVAAASPPNQFDALVSTSTSLELSVAQHERIRQNREKANKLREERLRKMQEQAQASLEVVQGETPVNNDEPMQVETSSEINEEQQEKISQNQEKEASSELNEEQQEKIRQNREKANKLRLERLQRTQEKTQEEQVLPEQSEEVEVSSQDKGLEIGETLPIATDSLNSNEISTSPTTVFSEEII